jgi:hypothetical protein
MINVIELVLNLLSTVLGQIKGIPGYATEIVTGIEAAIAELEKVRGTPVTYSQLESLRVSPTWGTGAPSTPPGPVVD